MSIRLGYQIPNYSYPGGDPARIFPTVVAQAQAAEGAGFDTVLVMDHFYQLPGLGAPDEPMLESYTALAGIAGATETVQLSALVTGNTYRNPPMLAKTVTTLDVVSGGPCSPSAPAGSSWSTSSSATTSARSPTDSNGSVRRSTSSSRCCVAGVRALMARGTALSRRSTSPECATRCR